MVRQCLRLNSRPVATCAASVSTSSTPSTFSSSFKSASNRLIHSTFACGASTSSRGRGCLIFNLAAFRSQTGTQHAADESDAGFQIRRFERRVNMRILRQVHADRAPHIAELREAFEHMVGKKRTKGASIWVNRTST